MFLYAIRDSQSNYIKLGYSADPIQRVRELQTGSSGALCLVHHAPIRKDRARPVEQQLHRDLNHLRERGEWFKLTENEARELIDFAIIRYEDDTLI